MNRPHRAEALAQDPLLVQDLRLKLRSTLRAVHDFRGVLEGGPMGVEIVARVDRSALAGLLAGLLPLTLRFGADERFLELAAADELSLAAGRGVRLVTHGRVQWTLAGVRLPIAIRALELLLSPQIVSDVDGDSLAFAPSIERMDLKSAPLAVEQGLTTWINQLITARSHALSWHFGRTLTRSWPLSPAMAPVEAFTMSVTDARVRVASDALELRLELPLGFTRAEPAKAS